MIERFKSEIGFFAAIIAEARLELIALSATFNGVIVSVRQYLVTCFSDQDSMLPLGR